MSSPVKSVSESAPTSTAADKAGVKPAATGPKPCCVCKDEKAARDECFLFSSKGGEVECIPQIEAYKKCMAGFGFKI
ncbi:cytochrome C oxidase copper chaperone-domain-containing protein [Pyronema omphalodes]|nr:cytochrome C oxidase copper chaperone-domain-containing protein [Pyronema omphalodes]